MEVKRNTRIPPPRVRTRERKLVQKAARKVGKYETEFVRDVALERAREVLSEDAEA